MAEWIPLKLIYVSFRLLLTDQRRGVAFTRKVESEERDPKHRTESFESIGGNNLGGRCLESDLLFDIRPYSSHELTRTRVIYAKTCTRHADDSNANVHLSMHGASNRFPLATRKTVVEIRKNRCFDFDAIEKNSEKSVWFIAQKMFVVDEFRLLSSVKTFFPSFRAIYSTFFYFHLRVVRFTNHYYYGYDDGDAFILSQTMTMNGNSTMTRAPHHFCCPSSSTSSWSRLLLSRHFRRTDKWSIQPSRIVRG